MLTIFPSFAKLSKCTHHLFTLLRCLFAFRAGVILLFQFQFQIKYGKIDSKANGNIREGVIFSTYVSLISKQSGDKNKTRLKQLVQWCGPNFDGCIIFDECHKAKHLVPSNGKPTQTGIAVLQLQEELPNARIVYASATGASEPRNMGYMVRLGLWGEGTQFKDFAQFLTAVEKRYVSMFIYFCLFIGKIFHFSLLLTHVLTCA